MAFYQALISNEEWKPLPEMARSDYTRKLADWYPGLTPAEKQWFGNLPAYWTGLCAEWTGLAPDQRAACREGLITQLSALRASPLASLPMHGGRFGSSGFVELSGQQGAFKSGMAAVAGQGAAISNLIDIFRR